MDRQPAGHLIETSGPMRVRRRFPPTDVRPLGLLTALAVVLAQLGSPPATVAGTGPPGTGTAVAASLATPALTTVVDEHDDAGRRPPSGMAMAAGIDLYLANVLETLV